MPMSMTSMRRWFRRRLSKNLPARYRGSPRDVAILGLPRAFDPRNDRRGRQRIASFEKRLAETRQQIANLSGRLANENYVNKAPAHLIEETRKELEQKEAYEVRLQAELSVLSD